MDPVELELSPTSRRVIVTGDDQNLVINNDVIAVAGDNSTVYLNDGGNTGVAIAIVGHYGTAERAGINIAGASGHATAADSAIAVVGYTAQFGPTAGAECSKFGGFARAGTKGEAKAAGQSIALNVSGLSCAIENGIAVAIQNGHAVAHGKSIAIGLIGTGDPEPPTSKMMGTDLGGILIGLYRDVNNQFQWAIGHVGEGQLNRNQWYTVNNRGEFVPTTPNPDQPDLE